MPTASTLRRARQAARSGKKPTTQAGEFIREEMHEYERGSGNVQSRKQAVAIGLSEARRHGVKLPPPKRGSKSVRQKAARDTAIARGKKVSPARSRGARQAARTRERRYHHAAR